MLKVLLDQIANPDERSWNGFKLAFINGENASKNYFSEFNKEITKRGYLDPD